MRLHPQYLFKSGYRWLLFLEACMLLPESRNSQQRGKGKWFPLNVSDELSCLPCWNRCTVAFRRHCNKQYETVHAGRYTKSLFPLPLAESTLFYSWLPAAEVMWSYICFTWTGPFYIIHYVQLRCQLLIQANPALPWRAALTNLASAFAAQPLMASSPSYGMWCSEEVSRGVQGHQSPIIPDDRSPPRQGCSTKPWAVLLFSLLSPLSSEATATEGDAVSGRASAENKELMCQDRHGLRSASVTFKSNTDKHTSGREQIVVCGVSLHPAWPNPSPIQRPGLFPWVSWGSLKITADSKMVFLFI